MELKVGQHVLIKRTNNSWLSSYVGKIAKVIKLFPTYGEANIQILGDQSYDKVWKQDLLQPTKFQIGDTISFRGSIISWSVYEITSESYLVERFGNNHMKTKVLFRNEHVYDKIENTKPEESKFKVGDYVRILNDHCSKLEEGSIHRIDKIKDITALFYNPSENFYWHIPFNGLEKVEVPKDVKINSLSETKKTPKSENRKFKKGDLVKGRITGTIFELLRKLDNKVSWEAKVIKTNKNGEHYFSIGELVILQDYEFTLHEKRPKFRVGQLVLCRVHETNEQKVARVTEITSPWLRKLDIKFLTGDQVISHTDYLTPYPHKSKKEKNKWKM